MPERRYSGEEAEEIFRRVGATRASSEDDAGLSLAELETVAAEVGVDPTLVRLEAQQTERNRMLDGGQRRFIGAPSQYEVDRLLDREIDGPGWSALVAEMERLYGRGEAKEEGGIRSWHRKTPFGFRHLTASTLDGRTLLRLSSNVESGLLLAMAGAALVVLIQGAAIFGNIAMPVWAVVLGALFLVALAAGAFRVFVSSWHQADLLKASAILESSDLVRQGFATASVHSAAETLEQGEDLLA